MIFRSKTLCHCVDIIETMFMEKIYKRTSLVIKYRCDIPLFSHHIGSGNGTYYQCYPKNIILTKIPHPMLSYSIPYIENGKVTVKLTEEGWEKVNDIFKN